MMWSSLLPLSVVCLASERCCKQTPETHTTKPPRVVAHPHLHTRSPIHPSLQTPPHGQRAPKLLHLPYPFSRLPRLKGAPLPWYDRAPCT
ncbi:hypothetical protein IWX48DRAFT_627239 [Phyllosticta citricarpa]